MKKCSLCDKPVRARGWCGMHYQRFQMHGDPNAPVSREKRIEKCSFDGCERLTGLPGTARGWCQLHYNRWLHNGDPNVMRSKAVYLTHLPCTVPGCTNNIAGRGLCEKHWMRNKRHGDPLAPDMRPPRWTAKELRHLYAILDRTADGLSWAVDKELVHLELIIDRSTAAIRSKLHELRARRKREANKAITKDHADILPMPDVQDRRVVYVH